MFGLYIIVHGHLTLGGGFAGGVILAGAFILQILANGKILPKLRKVEESLEFMESAAILGFLILAGLGLLFSGSVVFFANFLYRGEIGKLISGGFIPIENIVIGAEVCAAVATIFIAMLVYKDEEKK